MTLTAGDRRIGRCWRPRLPYHLRVTPDRINRPAPPASAEALAAAWAQAASHLPPEWAIYYLHGESTFGDHQALWIASAAGPNLDADYAEGIGPTPEAALQELDRELLRFAGMAR